MDEFVVLYVDLWGDVVCLRNRRGERGRSPVVLGLYV